MGAESGTGVEIEPIDVGGVLSFPSLDFGRERAESEDRAAGSGSSSDDGARRSAGELSEEGLVLDKRVGASFCVGSEEVFFDEEVEDASSDDGAEHGDVLLLGDRGLVELEGAVFALGEDSIKG